jgi:hypothetical protein
MNYGKYDATGAVEREATECILTGRAVDAFNSVREPITGTPYFYRVLGSQYGRVTDDMRAKWRAGAPADVSAPKAVKKGSDE